MHEPDPVVFGLEDGAVAPSEGGAGQHRRFAPLEAPVNEVPEALEPRLPVGVVERASGRHLFDVGLRVVVVAVEEGPAEALCQELADHRLTRAGDAHHDERKERLSAYPHCAPCRFPPGGPLGRESRTERDPGPAHGRPTR